jgi:cobalt-zinc-cadmium efflux system membrane fusion protein
MSDVHENDLSNLRVGEYADIHLNANPNMVRRGRIGNINPVLGSNLRTTRVRLEGSNPGLERLGMFVTARFHGLTIDVRAAIPATAVLGLCPGWGRSIPADPICWRQTILSDIESGQQVVANTLVLQSTVEQ